MLGQVQFEEIHTESECSQLNEDEESYNTSILDVFKEIEIRGDGNWLFGALSLGAFGDQEYHLTVREWYETILIRIVIDSKNLLIKKWIATL